MNNRPLINHTEQDTFFALGPEGWGYFQTHATAMKCMVVCVGQRKHFLLAHHTLRTVEIWELLNSPIYFLFVYFWFSSSHPTPLLLICLWDRISPCSLGWPQIQFIAQEGLQLSVINPFLSASLVDYKQLKSVPLKLICFRSLNDC